MRPTTLLTFVTLLGLGACSEPTLNDIDTNPNQLADAPLNTLLPTGLMTTIYQVAGSQAATGSSHMAELTTLTDVSSRVQTVLLGYGSGAWDNSFVALRTFRLIRQRAEAEQKWGYVAIADIMTAYTLSLLTDLFGDAPYTQAAGPQTYRQPTFDKATDQYVEIQRLLDSGIQNAAKATTVSSRPNKDDLLYAGNMNLWTKLAWGMKARFYNRLSNGDPQGSAQKAIDAVGKSFGPTETFAVTFYTNVSTNGNPLSNGYNNQATQAVGNGIVTALRLFLNDSEDLLSDPRAAIWFTRIGGKINPAPNGKAQTDVSLNGTVYSKPQHLKERAAPQPLLTYTELKFIEAEGQLRLGDADKAGAAYETALRLALAQAAAFNPSLALTPAQITAYLARPKVLPGPAGLSLNTILTQKYIYFFQFQPIEAYNDLRRTGFLPTSDPDGPAKRFPYPESERSRNVNAPQAINEQTVYSETNRLFWAKL